MSAEARQRIDKWLWHARVVRTRSAAAALVAAGRVRVNGDRIEAASRRVGPGDVLTVALDRAVRVLKVQALSDRRGAAEAARLLFQDLAPPPDGSHAGGPQTAPLRAADACASTPTQRPERK